MNEKNIFAQKFQQIWAETLEAELAKSEFNFYRCDCGIRKRIGEMHNCAYGREVVFTSKTDKKFLTSIPIPLRVESIYGKWKGLQKLVKSFFQK